jgi:hypothetical protein
MNNYEGRVVESVTEPNKSTTFDDNECTIRFTDGSSLTLGACGCCDGIYVMDEEPEAAASEQKPAVPFTVVFDGKQVRLHQHREDFTALDLAQVGWVLTRRALELA